MLANPGDEVIQFGMEKRLAAADGDYGCSEFAQLVDPLEHGSERNRWGKIVIFIAIFARQIAAPHRNDVRKQRMIGRDQRFSDFSRAAQIAMKTSQSAAQRC